MATGANKTVSFTVGRDLFNTLKERCKPLSKAYREIIRSQYELLALASNMDDLSAELEEFEPEKDGHRKTVSLPYFEVDDLDSLAKTSLVSRAHLLSYFFYRAGAFGPLPIDNEN